MEEDEEELVGLTMEEEMAMVGLKEKGLGNDWLRVGEAIVMEIKGWSKEPQANPIEEEERG